MILYKCIFRLSRLLSQTSKLVSINARVRQKDGYTWRFTHNFSGYQLTIRTFSLDAPPSNSQLRENEKSLRNYISLVLPDGRKRSVNWEQAKKIAHQYESEICETWNTDEQRMEYRLVRSKNKEPREQQSKSKVKATKKFEIRTTIGDNDLISKCSQIIKLVKRGQSVILSVWKAEHFGKVSKTSMENILEIVQREIQPHAQVHKPETATEVMRIRINSKLSTEEEEQGKDENKMR